MSTRLEIPVAGGFRMLVDTTGGIGRALIIAGTWEPQVTAAFRAFLSPGDICIDVGANVGYYTLLAANLVGARGHVYALEPAPETYAALSFNLELNGVSNVTALCVAAGAAPGDVVLDHPPGGPSLQARVRDVNRSPVADTAGTSVPVATVASLIRTSDVQRVRLIKIDVEGYELEVLRGLEPLLGLGVRPAILVEIHFDLVGATVTLLSDFCQMYGLTIYTLGDDGPHGITAWTGSPFELAQSLEAEYERRLLIAP